MEQLAKLGALLFTLILLFSLTAFLFTSLYTLYTQPRPEISPQPEITPQPEILKEEPQENVTIGEILKNPAVYNGRVVITEGRLLKSTLHPFKETPEGEKLNYALIDNQSFVISLIPPLVQTRSYIEGETYRVKGRVKYIETREYMSTEDYEWEIALAPYEMTEIS